MHYYEALFQHIVALTLLLYTKYVVIFEEIASNC